MTRYLRVGKNPRKVLPPTTVSGPTSQQPATMIDATGGHEANVTTSHTINIPTAVSGDFLVLIFYTDGTPSSTPTGWTADGSNPYEGIYVYTKVSDGTETSFTLSTTANAESAHICWSLRGTTTYEISGPAGPTGSGTGPNPPSISPSTAGIYLVYAIGGSSGVNDAGNWPGNATASSGYTLVDQGRGSSSGGDEKLWIGYAVVDITTAEDPGEMSPTTSTGYNSRAITMAFPYADPIVAAEGHTHVQADITDTAFGTSTITDTNSTVNVSHGLTGTPTAVLLTGDEDATLWVTSIGASTFTANRSGTTGELAFYWVAHV